MTRTLRSFLVTGIIVSTVIVAPHAAPTAVASPVAAKPAGMVVSVKITGDLHYSMNLGHAEDAAVTLPSTYSCIRFTHPNFPPKGKPLAYALSFDNPDVMAAHSGIFFSFYYNPATLASEHVDEDGGSALLVVPAKYVAFGPGGLGTYTVVAHLSKDLHSGSLKATNFRNLLGAGHVTIEASWSCPTVFVRPT